MYVPTAKMSFHTLPYGLVLLYYPACAGLYKFRVFHSGNKLSLTESKQVFYHIQAGSD